jgi:isochorismate hydrolase
MTDAKTATIKAEPFDLKFNPKTTALIIIDMQRDFFGWVSNADNFIVALG